MGRGKSVRAMGLGAAVCGWWHLGAAVGGMGSVPCACLGVTVPSWVLLSQMMPWDLAGTHPFAPSRQWHPEAPGSHRSIPGRPGPSGLDHPSPTKSQHPRRDRKDQKATGGCYGNSHKLDQYSRRGAAARVLQGAGGCDSCGGAGAQLCHPQIGAGSPSLAQANQGSAMAAETPSPCIFSPAAPRPAEHCILVVPIPCRDPCMLHLCFQISPPPPSWRRKLLL